MKNYEAYIDEIRSYEGTNFCNDFVKSHIPNTPSCSGAHCAACRMLQMAWLLEEYKEPEVDWSKVEVDTPILVRNYEDEKWEKRFFAKFEYDYVLAWDYGRTSWNESEMIPWNYAKLAESEEK